MKYPKGKEVLVDTTSVNTAKVVVNTTISTLVEVTSLSGSPRKRIVDQV